MDQADAQFNFVLGQVRLVCYQNLAASVETGRNVLVCH